MYKSLYIKHKLLRLQKTVTHLKWANHSDLTITKLRTYNITVTIQDIQRSCKVGLIIQGTELRLALSEGLSLEISKLSLKKSSKDEEQEDRMVGEIIRRDRVTRRLMMMTNVRERRF